MEYPIYIARGCADSPLQLYQWEYWACEDCEVVPLSFNVTCPGEATSAPSTTVPITVAPTVATSCTTSDMKMTIEGTFWDGEFALQDSGAFSRDLGDYSDAMLYFKPGGLASSTSTSTSGGCDENDAWFIVAYSFYVGYTSDTSFNLGVEYPYYFTDSCVGHPALIDTQWYERLSSGTDAFPVTVTFSC